MDRDISIMKDFDEHKIVVIHDIIFKGKRAINWSEIKIYLNQYAGEFYEIAESKDFIYIGSDSR